MNTRIIKSALLAIITGALISGCSRKTNLQDEGLEGFNLTEKKDFFVGGLTDIKTPVREYQTKEGYIIVKRGEGGEYFLVDSFGRLLNGGNKYIGLHGTNIFLGTATSDIRSSPLQTIISLKDDKTLDNIEKRAWILNYLDYFPEKKEFWGFYKRDGVIYYRCFDPSE